MAFSVGETLQDGRYHLQALLDQHAWGMTFLARHNSVDQQVVIKTFQSASEGPTPLQVASYIDYAKKLRRFHHPHLSRVISIFEERDHACMVSEFVQGVPLPHLIQTQPLSENTALLYIHQVAQGLHALHRHGLLHLNLSPDRILKRQGDSHTVLLGLNSRFASQDAERHKNPYFSFEQHQVPAMPSLAAEIYGISAILYYLVTGQAPTPACDRIQTPLILPRKLRPELSQSIEEAILTGMALAPSDRPQRMKDWMKLLPQPQKADAKTKLQIPSAWHVKLPAFHEAGMEQSVSKTITPQDRPETKTTLQVTAPAQDNDQTPSTNGQDNSNLVTVGSLSRPSAGQALSSKDEHSASASSTPPAVKHEDTEAPVALSEPEVQPSAVQTYMPVTPHSQTHRFPKWTLFWCALVAAFGGLGAGLWLRIQITRQFAMPPQSDESSPLEQLKTLKTKQEEFLPTQSSIIPEEEIDPESRESSQDFYEFDSSENSAEDENLRPADDGRFVDSQWRESEPWRGVSGDVPDRGFEPDDGIQSRATTPEEEARFIDETQPIWSAPSEEYDLDLSEQASDNLVNLENPDSFASETPIEPSIEEEYRSYDSSYDPNAGTY